MEFLNTTADVKMHKSKNNTRLECKSQQEKTLVKA